MYNSVNGCFVLVSVQKIVQVRVFVCEWGERGGRGGAQIPNLSSMNTGCI